MESLPPHHEGPISPSLPHVKIEPTTDHWNPPLIQSVMSNFSENTPTYTCLEPVYPETSYAPSSTQYFQSSSTTIQPLYSSCTISPVDQPLLHNALYRDVDLHQTARDEGLGSSPSSFSSTTPPLQHHQTNGNGHIVEPSRPSSNPYYSQRSTSSTPESVASRIEPTTDFWNTPLIQPVNNASEKTPVYTALKPVYPEESYAPSSTQYFPVSSSSSTNQPLYAFCTMPQDNQPSLHTALYTDVDLNQTERDEGLGSSPSSSSSTTPPLPRQQTNAYEHIVGTSSNLDYFQRSTSSTPESIVFSSYSPECSNCGNRNDIFWYSTHYLCRQCLPERPAQVQQASPVLEDSSKRKRSVATNKNLNQICTNCEATQSKLWRRSISSGNTVCNACGLYEKLHHVPRPKHMRKDTIQSRKRKPKASRSSPKVKSSSRKNAKKSTSETTLSPQYIPNDVQPTYNLPTYNTLPARDFSSSNNNTHMLPPINNQTFYAHFRPEMYIYNSVAPNDIINIAQGLPSNIPFSSS